MQLCKPIFTTVDKLQPQTHGHTLTACVLSARIVLDKPATGCTRLAECLVGDPTGTVLLTARNDQRQPISGGMVVVGGGGGNAWAKEITLRRRMSSMSDSFLCGCRRKFNKTREHCPSLKDYNDYLEEVEDMTFNPIEGIDLEAIEARIARYQQENAEQIYLPRAKREGGTLAAGQNGVAAVRRDHRVPQAGVSLHEAEEAQVMDGVPDAHPGVPDGGVHGPGALDLLHNHATKSFYRMLADLQQPF